MGGILQHWRIPAATLFSVALVAGAYLFARSVSSPPLAEASTESALLQAIAQQDTDSDGLPNWEEALYGTKSDTADTFKLGMTDGEAVAQGLIVSKVIANIPTATSTTSGTIQIDPSLPVPAEGSITSAFAKNFFTLYIRAVQQAPGGNLSEAQMQQVATDALAELAKGVTLAPDFKSLSQLKVEGSGEVSLRAFAVSAEAVLVANKNSATKSEIFYLKDAVEDNDDTVFPHILSLAEGYRASATGLAAIPVPRELTEDDLALINALARVSGITEDFARVRSDPMVTMLALQQYPEAVLDLGKAFIRIARVYKSAGITFVKGEPGASFVNLIADIAEKQSSEKKP